MQKTDEIRPLGGWLSRNAIWLTLIPVLLSMWIIFYFSAQPAVESNEASSHIVDAVIRLFVPDFGQWDAIRQAELTGTLTLIVRKLAHALEYAMLGFFLHLHVFAWRRLTRRVSAGADATAKRRRIPWWVWGPIIGVLYAATDEWHQGFVADRAPRIGDVGVDAVGLIAGTAVCALVLLITRRIGERKGKRTV